MKKKFMLQLAVFILLLSLTFGSFVNPYKNSNQVFSMQMTTVAKGVKSDALYNKIKSYAEKNNVKPQDAVIHKVWKAIPGYNGLSVDINASYEKMKKSNQFDKNKIVFNQVSPNIHLSDLPPAPIYRGNLNKPMVSFLINVAWGNEYIPKILKILSKYHIKATFFLDGSWVKKNPELAVMISEEGHEIGNHAYSHPNMSKLSQAEMKSQLEKTNRVIEATLDVKPKWFAPPSGSYNNQVVQTAGKMGMGTILWTADTVDWKNPHPDQMVQRVVSKVGNGAMILMHPTASTANGLEQLINDIQSRGYQIGTVSQLLSEKRLTVSP